MMRVRKALLVVDVQNDFCPKGALAVPEGDKIIPAINSYIAIFAKAKLPIIATRDWHPKVTRHFKRFGGKWPVHCIAGTKGADFCAGLKLTADTFFLYKGMNPAQDSYSAFHAEDKVGVTLGDYLNLLEVEELYIAGLATDYCVRFTTRDAIQKGFTVKILTDAIKGVNIKPDDSREAISEMLRLGAKKMTLKNVRI